MVSGASSLGWRRELSDVDQPGVGGICETTTGAVGSGPAAGSAGRIRASDDFKEGSVADRQGGESLRYAKMSSHDFP